MKNVFKIGLFLIAGVSWLLLAIYFSRLPELIPIHWNIHGEIDRWGSKNWAILLPGIISLTVVLAFVLPLISPRGFRLDGATHALVKVIFWISAYLLLVQWLILQASLNPEMDLIRWLFMATGGLLVAVGNLLGKFPKNFFVGVRTPWTLANDTVWDKTHRLARTCFVVAGMILPASAIYARQSGWLVAGAILLAVLVPVVYSYIAYRQQERSVYGKRG